MPPGALDAPRELSIRDATWEIELEERVSVDSERRMVTLRTDHFSIYVVARVLPSLDAGVPMDAVADVVSDASALSACPAQPVDTAALAWQALPSLAMGAVDNAGQALVAVDAAGEVYVTASFATAPDWSSLWFELLPGPIQFEGSGAGAVAM